MLTMSRRGSRIRSTRHDLERYQEAIRGQFPPPRALTNDHCEVTCNVAAPITASLAEERVSVGVVPLGGTPCAIPLRLGVTLTDLILREWEET